MVMLVTVMLVPVVQVRVVMVVLMPVVMVVVMVVLVTLVSMFLAGMVMVIDVGEKLVGVKNDMKERGHDKSLKNPHGRRRCSQKN